MASVHRRKFLAASGTALASTCAISSATAKSDLASPTLSKKLAVSLSLPWPDDVAGPAESAHRLARRIETLSDGRIAIEITPSGLRDAELCFGAESARVSDHPAFAYVAGLLGRTAISAKDLDAWLRIGGGQEMWDDLAANWGTKPLLAGHTGPTTGLWSRSAIREVADLRNRAVVATGLSALVVAGLGAQPAAPPSGSADVLGWEDEHSLASPAALARSETYPHLALPGLAPEGAALTLHVRHDLWHQLALADRALLEAAAAEEFWMTLGEARTFAAAAGNALAHRGVLVAPLSSELRTAIDGVSEAVIAQTAASDATARAIDASYMAFRNEGMSVVS